jgi:hypothetical protein
MLRGTGCESRGAKPADSSFETPASRGGGASNAGGTHPKPPRLRWINRHPLVGALVNR